MIIETHHAPIIRENM